MRRLYYASGAVLVSDPVCKAVLRYARALADSGRYDVVAVPVFGADGADARAHLLLGPSSELFATPVADGGVDAEIDPDLIRQLERRTRGLEASRAESPEDAREVSGLDRGTD
jgi:hypothetical protein